MNADRMCHEVTPPPPRRLYNRLTYRTYTGKFENERRLITLHLLDLKALQASKGWKHFYFLSENQPGYDCTKPFKLSLTFSSMVVLTTPPFFTIYLMKMDDCLGLDFITAVDCEPHVLGDLLKISCKGGKQYIIVAQ